MFLKSDAKDSTVYLAKVAPSDSIYREEEDNQVLTETDIAKFNDDQHMVFGWANVSVNADGSIPLDWQGDICAPKILEKAAYEFVLKYRATGEMHEGESKGILIESVMFTKEKMAAMGIPEGTVPEGWWVGFFIPDDEVCAKIKSGEYKMFSIQGKAKRLKV